MPENNDLIDLMRKNNRLSMPIRKCTLDPLIDREKGKAMIRAHVDCK